MAEDRPMELIRLPREEQLYEREAVLGRDVSSVFPSHAQKQKEEQLDSVKKAVGLDQSKFISASELEKLKHSQTALVENGVVARDKTLAAVLAENKAAKEEAFQQQWKTMKQGKNRPLDEDDLQFVNGILESENAKEQSRRQQERSELEAFQEAVKQAAELRQQSSNPPASTASTDEAGRDSTQPGAQNQGQVQKRPAPRPLVKVKQKQKRDGEDLRGQAAKIAKSGAGEAGTSSSVDALASLMGDYASDSDSPQDQ